MKTFLKIIMGIVIVITLLVVGLFLFVSNTWDKPYDAPYPQITASTDSTVIARGKYLAYGPAHCATCHIPMDKITDLDNGAEVPLSGGWELTIDPGTFRARNLTPDLETGIGKLTDQEIARIMREAVGHDGRFIFPFMPFQNMTDDDVTALISFLRSQAAIKNEIQPTEYSFLGKMILTLGLLKPEGPTGIPAKSIQKDSTVLYGEYLANSVANCKGCHTARDLKTGEFTGISFAGGFAMPPDPFSKGYSFLTPNLTPDPETGVITHWTEEVFVKRFKKGKLFENSPMPWSSFARMEEVELKAIYRYLKSLDPVDNKIEKVIYAPGEVIPGA